MRKDFVNRIREKINVKLFSHKEFVLNSLRVLSILVSLGALSSLIYYYGFPKTMQSSLVVSRIITFSIAFYIFKYLTHLFYHFHPVQFLKETRTEGIILLLIVLGATFYNLFDFALLRFVNSSFGFDLNPWVNLFVQLYFLVLVGMEAGKAGHNLKLFQLGPSTLMTLSFLILITFGTLLLYLPEMTNGGIRFIDALFTSTSACCVTGLAVVDTGTYFTLKGQIVILLLIQLGGINIVSFATFFATFYKNSSVKYQSILKDFLMAGKMSDTRSLLRRIIFFSLIIELIGTIFIYLTWHPQLEFASFKQKFYYSLFHSVSAFNNAGFSLFRNNLYENWVNQSLNLHIIIAVLIFLGGIGFSTLENLTYIFSDWKRVINIKKHLTITSQIVLKTSILLIIAGAIVFIFAEWNNTLRGMSPWALTVTSVFQSVTARTAGFNTVDFTALAQPVLIFFIFLMYIGASPQSTGGGIKTTTFAIILKTSLATIRGKKNVETHHHTIAFSLIDKAYAIALFAMFLIFFSTFALSFTESDIRFLHLIFEEVSAFATVGLSTGITPFLSDAGKAIIVTSMFIGRIGPLTLALFLSRTIVSKNYRYPEIQVMIG